MNTTTLLYGFRLESTNGLPFGDDGEFLGYDHWLECLGGVDHSKRPRSPFVSHEEWGVACRQIKEWRDMRADVRRSVTSIRHHICWDDSIIFYAVCIEPSGYAPKPVALRTTTTHDHDLADMAKRLGVTDPEIGWWFVSNDDD